MASTVVINGRTFAGKNVTVVNDRVFIDGKNVTPDAKEITITVTGNIDQLKADACSQISVTGDVGSVTTQSGDVSVGGSVNGSVQTMSGDVDCNGRIGGNVTTMSGDISSR